MATTVTHTVLFQIKPDASPDGVKKVCADMLALKHKCLHPATQRPYIISLKGGSDNSSEGLQRGMTHGFVVEFASVADRDYYVSLDPAHKAFVNIVGSVVEKVIVVDFSDGVY